MISRESGKFLLALSRQTMEAYIKTGKKIKAPEKYPTELSKLSGIFVTINKKLSAPGSPKELRGCVGLPYPKKSLVEGVVEATLSACQDSRFTHIGLDELLKLSLEISILTEPELIKVKKPEDYLKLVRPNIDGLILEKGVMSGLFLPQVWESFHEPIKFIEKLCYKAGLNKDTWKDPAVKIYKFQVQIFEE